MNKLKTFLKKYKKTVIIVGIIIVLLVLIIGLFIKGGSNGFKTFIATKANVTEKVELAGKVESNAYAELGFEVSGKINSVPVGVGDEVERGQILVQMDSSELYADLKDAEALVNIRKLELDNAEINLDDIKQQQDVLVSSAKRKLLASDLEAVAQSKLNTLDAPTISGTYIGDEGEYKIIIDSEDVNKQKHPMRVFGIETYSGFIESVRSNTLGTKGLYVQLPDSPSQYADTIWYVSIPNRRGDDYTTNLNAYEAALEARTVAIREAESSLTEGSREDSIAQAELAQAQARVDRILSQIEQRTIRAPFGGTVSNMEISVGEIASSGSIVAAVVSDGDYEISLDVPEIDVSKLEVGNKVDIRLDAFGNREIWQGEVTAISQAENYVDGVPVYETLVVFDQVDERIRSGLSSTVSIVTDSKVGVIAVPAEYIDRDSEGNFVNVVTGNSKNKKTEKRYVSTGLRGANGLVEILDGLVEGEVVGLES